MVSGAEPVVREAEHDDVVAICRFGEAHIRPHYAPLIGAAAADEQVRRWWNETHIGAAVAEVWWWSPRPTGSLSALGSADAAEPTTSSTSSTSTPSIAAAGWVHS